MNHEAEEQLTKERKMLFAVETKINSLLSLYISPRPETTLALRATQLATMWLGKAKGALGIKTPYTQSYDPKSAVIEKRADTVEAEGFPEGTDEVAAVKFLRAELNNIEKAIDNDSFLMVDHKKYQLCIQNAYTHCCEATMWLGMTLNAIKKEQDRASEKESSQTPVVKFTDVITGSQTETVNVKVTMPDQPSVVSSVVQEPEAPVAPTPENIKTETTVVQAGPVAETKPEVQDAGPVAVDSKPTVQNTATAKPAASPEVKNTPARGGRAKAPKDENKTTDSSKKEEESK